MSYFISVAENSYPFEVGEEGLGGMDFDDVGDACGVEARLPVAAYERVEPVI